MKSASSTNGVDELQPAIEVPRRLEITVDYNDPAFQEMAIASVPTHFDGAITDGLPLEEAWKAAVRANLEVTLRFAESVTEFKLPDDAEPAPIFKA